MRRCPTTCRIMENFDRWLQPRPSGLYCIPGDFYVDPHLPVDKAIITHGHSDHARPGHAAVLAAPETADIMKIRLGEHHAQKSEVLAFGDTLHIGEVDVRLAPAGHILGSAQVVIDYRGQRAVISGDYKRAGDPTCAPFEVINCDLFVTEATFGLPVFTHEEPAREIAKLLSPHFLSAPIRSASMGWANVSGSCRCCGKRDTPSQSGFTGHCARSPITIRGRESNSAKSCSSLRLKLHLPARLCCVRRLPWVIAGRGDLSIP